MPEPIPAPLARSPIRPAEPVRVVDGWELSARTSTARLRLADLSSLAKTLVKAAPQGAVASFLGVGFGRSRRDGKGRLFVGSGPDEWVVVGPTGSALSLRAELAEVEAAERGGDGLVTVVDVTHGRALMRLSGERSASVLNKLCAIDTSERVTPAGAAFRSFVAKVITDVVRDDVGGRRSYLLHCERSSGQYLFDAVLDAGREFGAEVSAMAGDGL